jgi:Bacterial dnaA protein helix-turn-helix
MNMTFTARPMRDPDRVIDAFVQLRGIDKVELLRGTSQTRDITQLRHELMWLLRDITHLSYEGVGFLIGDRDCATVHAGVAKVSDRIMQDQAYRAHLQALHAAILTLSDPATGTCQPTALSLARRFIADPDRHGTDVQAMALAVVSAASFIVNADLTDSEARFATRTLLCSREAFHGN